MSKKLIIAAVALMAISAPTAAFAGGYNSHPNRIVDVMDEQFNRDCAKGGSSAARGSIYDMAGPCGVTSIMVKVGDYCEYWSYRHKHYHKAKGKIANYLCRKYVPNGSDA